MEIEGLTDFGQRIDWKAYRGKVVLIDFWATWCGPCRAEIPNIKAIHKEFPRTVFDIVAINLDREEGALAAFLKENPLPWTNVIGNDASNVAKKYSITALPTMMAIGPNGKILAVAHRVEALKPAIEKAIRELP
jgi:thiol-disulfide isomerase/thioredoxin